MEVVVVPAEAAGARDGAGVEKPSEVAEVDLLRAGESCGCVAKRCGTVASRGALAEPDKPGAGGGFVV